MPFPKISNRAALDKLPIKEDIGDVVMYVNEIIDEAIEMKVSDVHIEPDRNSVLVRFRESGEFIFIDKFSHEEYAKALSRIKLMANLRLDEKQRPQDGKITYTSERFGGLNVDIRVSAMPVIDGEKLVLRILRQDMAMLALEKLDFLDINMTKIQEALQHKHGMILVAGPTGSGKSTTLFSMLRNYDPLKYNITTLEDPVEYNIPYVNQTNVRPQVGFDFASGLRSIVRQDPDIIMVGEIRDKETAMLAIEAALTGHLVFSTIHTNSAAGTVQRLINMGIEPFLVASALKMIIAQRLVKTVCKDCAQTLRLSDGPALDFVEKNMGDILEEDVRDIEFLEAHGCEKCNELGYKGRMGVHEVLVMDEAIEPYVLARASSHELETVARENGMITITQDALIKAATGKVALDEALKIV